MKQEQEAERLPLLLVILLACLMTAAEVCIYLLMGREPAWSGQLEYEADVVMGDIPGRNVEGRQRGLNSVMEEGMLSMSINMTPPGYVGGRDRAVNWLIEDPFNQGKLIRMEIIRDDTGELIYRAGIIRPGSYVESAEPLLGMPAGVHDYTAVFYAYKVETEGLIGQAAVGVRLTLLEGGEGKSY